MKRINLFIKTYFYYNKQELKSIYILLGLILLVSLSSTFYNWFVTAEPILFEQKLIETLAQQNQNDENENNLAKEVFNPKYNLEKPKPDKKQYFIIDSIKPKKYQAPLDINLADSIQLVALYRIGPALASKIIQYREKLGGYYNLNQLTEIWGFDPDILYDLDGKIFVSSNYIKPFNLNTVELEELKKHPYFKFKLSQAIVNYRYQHGPYKQLSDLKNIKIVTDSIINIIKPYCLVE
ncbi:MAG: ComEA family DNA-binding protein [Bacteroidia bacterium]